MACTFQVKTGDASKSFKKRADARRYARENCGSEIRRVCKTTSTPFQPVKCRRKSKYNPKIKWSKSTGEDWDDSSLVPKLGATKKKTDKKQAQWESLIDERVAEQEAIATAIRPLEIRHLELIDAGQYVEAKRVFAEMVATQKELEAKAKAKRK